MGGEQMQQVINYRKQIDKLSSVTELMGIEGNIRRSYYSAWNIIIDQEIEFDKRVMYQIGRAHV